MAYVVGEANSIKISLEAGADLSSSQYLFVKLSGGKAVACSGATDVPLGVLQNAPKSGQEAEIVVVGGTKIVSSGNLSADSIIGTSSAGKAAALTVGTDTTKYAVGRLLDAPGADGVVASAIIDCAAPGRAS